MLAAHAIATVLAAVLLSRGEDAVRAVVRALLPQPLRLLLLLPLQHLLLSQPRSNSCTRKKTTACGGFFSSVLFQPFLVADGHSRGAEAPSAI